MTDIKFYKTENGEILLGLIKGKENSGLKELIPGEIDGTREKHIPEISVKDGKTIIDVGSVEHPMMEVHYIQFITLKSERGVEIVYLKPGEKPHAEFDEVEHGIAYEYCNLHGLWKKEF